MHVVLDDHLHAELHVNEAGNDNEAHHHRNERMRKRSLDFLVRRTAIHNKQDDEKDEKRHVGNGCHALTPEVLCAFLGGAEATNLSERCTHIHDRLSP
ncbi:hypothetical protein D3C80_1858030 [compost metagenome]